MKLLTTFALTCLTALVSCSPTAQNPSHSASESNQPVYSKEPHQIRTSTQLLSIPNSNLSTEIQTLLAKKTLTDGEYMRLKRKIAKMKGANIGSMPSVVGRGHDSATLEIIREAPNSKQWIGYRYFFKAERHDAMIKAKHRLQYHSVSGMQFSEIDYRPEAPLNNSTEIQKYSQQADTNVRDGHVVLLKVDIPSSTSSYYLAHQPILIDATGSRLLIK